MKITIFGDFNANKKWLKRLLDQSSAQPVDRYVCHGDIASKLRNFQIEETLECVHLLNQYKVYCILGNHEEELLESLHNTQIPKELSDFLTPLPKKISLARAVIAHKPPSGRFTLLANTSEFDYLNSSQNICFFGHSHKRFHFQRQGHSIKTNYLPRFNLGYDVSEGLHLVNTGTTNFALPFTLDISPGYVIYDSDKQTITFKKITRHSS
jgi:predicted phosphodiesterase